MDVSHTTSSLSSMYSIDFLTYMGWVFRVRGLWRHVRLQLITAKFRGLCHLYEKNLKKKKQTLIHNLSRDSRWNTVFGLAEFPFPGNFYQFSILLYQNTIIMDLWNWNIKLYVCRSSCILVHYIASM